MSSTNIDTGVSTTSTNTNPVTNTDKLNTNMPTTSGVDQVESGQSSLSNAVVKKDDVVPTQTNTGSGGTPPTTNLNTQPNSTVTGPDPTSPLNPAISTPTTVTTSKTGVVTKDIPLTHDVYTFNEDLVKQKNPQLIEEFKKNPLAYSTDGKPAKTLEEFVQQWQNTLKNGNPLANEQDLEVVKKQNPVLIEEFNKNPALYSKNGQPAQNIDDFIRNWQQNSKDVIAAQVKAGWADPNVFSDKSSASNELTNAQIQEANMQKRLTDPNLPPGAKMEIQRQLLQQGEDVSKDGSLANANARQGNASLYNAVGVNASTVAETQTASNDPVQQLAAKGTSKYFASLLDAGSNNITVGDKQTVAGQLSSLLNFDPNQPLPSWARGAVTSAQQLLAARGMDASSMAGQAITAALVSAALPIAQTDAATYQQTALANQQKTTNLLLSNQAADNASKQFNASSDNQVNQFIASLADSINKFNASQINNMSQFNASQTQQADIFSAAEENKARATNAQTMSQMEQFNATQQNLRDNFNAQQGLVINQSNAQWRRQINTQNTAAQNEANRINSQNILGISNDAQAKLWQQARDEAAWTYTSTENAKDRGLKLAQSTLDYNSRVALMGMQQQNQMMDQLGSFAGNVFGKIAGKVIDNIFSGSRSTVTDANWSS